MAAAECTRTHYVTLLLISSLFLFLRLWFACVASVSSAWRTLIIVRILAVFVLISFSKRCNHYPNSIWYITKRSSRVWDFCERNFRQSRDRDQRSERVTDKKFWRKVELILKIVWLSLTVREFGFFELCNEDFK